MRSLNSSLTFLPPDFLAFSIARCLLLLWVLAGYRHLDSQQRTCDLSSCAHRVLYPGFLDVTVPLEILSLRTCLRFSDKYPFRMRSETADIAIELSMQPWHAFRPDGVIMFSDILTPLPAMGIEFDVVRGKGPIIQEPIRRCLSATP